MSSVTIRVRPGLRDKRLWAWESVFTGGTSMRDGFDSPEQAA